LEDIMGETSRPLAIVTGASSGIGFELARQFAKNGFDLVIAAEQEEIERAAERLRKEGARVEAVRVDLATAEGCAELARRASSVGKPLEAIALNAGVGVGGDFARETELEGELNIVELNCASTVRLAKWAVKEMLPRGRGRILITASIAGIMPTPLEAVYGASKAFDLSFAASLHAELEDTGLTVTALMPGPTDTEFFHRAGLDDTKVAEKAKENDPADVARMGFEALMAGKERIVAGNFSVKMQGYLARFMPESVKASMHKSMSEHDSGSSERH
jgi:short-subunit dehydrogenase